jgi:TolB-like protein
MHHLEKIPGRIFYSTETVNKYLQKVISDPVFSVSQILKRFLIFIVQETLQGRSDQLKEYTIGINVLNKPADFNPQADAIVRIHACRLRRALSSYYSKSGKGDLLRISVPKGNYIPFFYQPGFNRSPENKSFRLKEENPVAAGPSRSRVAAVMPFSYFAKEEKIISFAEGIASQLSAELACVDNLSVIAYYPIRFLNENLFYLKDEILKAGAQYLFTGNVQCLENRIRLNIQMIHAGTYEQIWGRLFERKLTETNMFDIQDEVIRQVLAEVENIWKTKKTGISHSSTMAVA